MGKVPGNRKELKPVIVAQLWNEVKDKMTVTELCKVLGLPRSTFYRWVNTTQVSTNEIEKTIKKVCLRHKLRYGYRRITVTLRKMGICINHKKYAL